MLWLNPSPRDNLLYVRFQKGRLIARTERFAENALIDLDNEGGPIGVSIHAYYTQPTWPFTEELVTKYSLSGWLDDLTTVRDSYFNPKGKLRLQGTTPRR